MSLDEDKTESTCRTCLLETQELRSIFRTGKICGEITMLSDMLAECTALEITEDDLLPQHICNKCVLLLSKAYMFRRSCISSDSTLREKIKTKAAEEDEVLGTLYFYDEPEAENTVEDVNEPLQSDDYEEIHMKQEATPSESNSIAEDDTIVENQYEQIDTNESIEQLEEFDSVSEEYRTLYGIEVGNRGKEIVYRKQRKRSSQVPGTPFKCSVCGKILSNHSSYKYHMQLHSDKTPFLCSECGEGFKTRNAYDGHMTTHDENNPHKCNVCGKTYRQAGSLRSHMLTHTGEKPFLCGICGKGMTQKSGFKKHMLTHTDEKPHRCDICGSLFRFSSNLITHKRRHTGEKPYTCTICGKSFVGSEQLKRHGTIHTTDKVFKCEVCKKVFKRKSSLQLHMNLHTNENKFVCQICGRCYPNMKGLSNHLQTHKEYYEQIEQQQQAEQHDEADEQHEQENADEDQQQVSEDAEMKTI